MADYTSEDVQKFRDSLDKTDEVEGPPRVGPKHRKEGKLPPKHLSYLTDDEKQQSAMAYEAALQNESYMPMVQEFRRRGISESMAPKMGLMALAAQSYAPEGSYVRVNSLRRTKAQQEAARRANRSGTSRGPHLGGGAGDFLLFDKATGRPFPDRSREAQNFVKFMAKTKRTAALVGADDNDPLWDAGHVEEQGKTGYGKTGYDYSQPANDLNRALGIEQSTLGSPGGRSYRIPDITPEEETIIQQANETAAQMAPISKASSLSDPQESIGGDKEYIFFSEDPNKAVA